MRALDSLRRRGGTGKLADTQVPRRPSGPGRSAWRSVAHDTVWIALLTVPAAVLVVLLAGARIPVPVLVGIAAVIVVGARLVRWIAVSEPSDPAAREDAEAVPFAMPDRPFAGMRSWEERLELVRGDGAYFRRTVVPQMAELVDERLRLAYGIDRSSAPGRARELLGPDLADFLDSERVRGRAPSRSDIDALVTEMEKLWTRQR